jgi:hypothetical protein
LQEGRVTITTAAITIDATRPFFFAIDWSADFILMRSVLNALLTIRAEKGEIPHG